MVKKNRSYLDQGTSTGSVVISGTVECDSRRMGSGSAIFSPGRAFAASTSSAGMFSLKPVVKEAKWVGTG